MEIRDFRELNGIVSCYYSSCGTIRGTADKVGAVLESVSVMVRVVRLLQ
jgi:hypothetical protein